MRMRRADANIHFRELQDDMIMWARGGLPVVGQFDGTVASLVHCYQTDPDSPFHKLRYKSRRGYQQFFKRIVADIGDEAIEDLKARRVLRWHEDLLKRGTPMAHGTITIFRIVLTFGATIMESPACRDARAFMADLKFPLGQKRTAILTAEQATAIRTIAHERGLHSVALAQAFQFECMFRQKDIIGEWVPQSEPGLSDVLDGNSKWMRGIRWEEIDGNLLLHHVTSKRQKLSEPDLKLAPMVLEELARIGERPSRGPIIVCERTGLPWTEHYFRRIWRNLAAAAGIPASVRNMDTRAGSISEATDAGAAIEHVRHAATHSDIATTQGYSRDGAAKTATVQQLRVAHRNAQRTS